MYQLYELCRWNARYVIDEGYKSLLLNHLSIIKILAFSLRELDKLKGIRPYSMDEYLEMAHNHKELDSITKQIHIVYDSYKNIKTDDNLSIDEKIIILKKSIDFFENIFDDLCLQDAYLDNEKLSNGHAQIIIDLKNKCNAIDGALPIIKYLKESNNNFLLSLGDGIEIYPVVTDILYDTFTLEYLLSQQDDIIFFLKSPKIFPITQQKQIQKHAFSITFYEKIVFFQQVHIKKAKIFILHEYARALKCDIKSLKKLYKELLYYDANVHSSALKSGIEISKIAPRQFLMPTIRMVRKIEYTGIKHAHSDISL